MQFYVLFKNISVISGRSEDDNEKLCTTKLRFPSERYPPRSGFKPGIGSAGKR